MKAELLRNRLQELRVLWTNNPDQREKLNLQAKVLQLGIWVVEEKNGQVPQGSITRNVDEIKFEQGTGYNGKAPF
jgi:hypothetical protein